MRYPGGKRMKNKLNGVCAIAVSAAILLSTLTACGQKINGGSKSQNIQGNQTAVYPVNGNGSANAETPADSQNDAGGSFDSGNSSGGSYSGGSSSSGGSYSGGSSGGSYSGRGSSSSGGSSSNPGKTQNSSVSSDKTGSSTTATTTTTSKTTKYVYDIKKIINNAPLNPMQTNDPDLDKIIDEIFAKIITDDMTTYEKTRVLFDYLVQNNEYGYLAAVGTQTSYVSLYDVDVVTRAKTIFKYKRGTCIDFAAAFMCLTRRIGLNCYMVQGRITDLNGKTYHHGWNTIRVDGVDYTFDSQADFRVRQRDANGRTKFVNFGTYYPQVFPVQYVNLAVNTFKNFRTF